MERQHIIHSLTTIQPSLRSKRETQNFFKEEEEKKNWKETCSKIMVFHISQENLKVILFLLSWSNGTICVWWHSCFYGRWKNAMLIPVQWTAFMWYKFRVKFVCVITNDIRTAHNMPLLLIVLCLNASKTMSKMLIFHIFSAEIFKCDKNFII